MDEEAKLFEYKAIIKLKDDLEIMIKKEVVDYNKEMAKDHGKDIVVKYLSLDENEIKEIKEDVRYINSVF